MSANGRINGTVPERRDSTPTSATIARIEAGKAGRCEDDSVVNAMDSFRNGNARFRQPQKQVAEFTPEVLESKRAAILKEKQAVLKHAMDRHDDLVRELFHMQQFTMMIKYDPVEAKNDTTQVFQDFKSTFDLSANAIPTSGETRRTRQSVTERRQILQNVSTPSVAPSSSLTPAKKKAKSRNLNAERILDVIASPKGHKKPGKAKYDVEEGARSESEVPRSSSMVPELSESRRVHAVDGTVSRRIPPRKKCVVDNATISLRPLSLSDPRFGPVLSTEPRTRKRKRDDSPVLSPLSSISDKMQDIHSSRSVKESLQSHVVKDTSISAGPTRRSGRLKEVPMQSLTSKALVKNLSSFPNGSSNIGSHSPACELTSLPYSPSPLNIKRIKLIVRRPPPKISNPKQIPPKPKFNNSLHDLLSSYTPINEGREKMNPIVLQREVLEEAKLREKVAKLRREGRFVSQKQADEEDGMGLDGDLDYSAPERTSKDCWDAVIGEAIHRYQTKSRRSTAKQVTSAITYKVQVHFDNLEAKRLKAREAEEKKLRNLAKATMKAVIAEWKKAVYHIREKQRLEEEEEERRLGRAHLDAILSQSGQILETQQEDLTKRDGYRSQSRSSSQEFDEEEDGGATSQTDFDDQTEDIDNEESKVGHGSDSDEDLKEADDESSAMLLGIANSAERNSIIETETSIPSVSQPWIGRSGMSLAGADFREFETDVLAVHSARASEVISEFEPLETENETTNSKDNPAAEGEPWPTELGFVSRTNTPPACDSRSNSPSLPEEFPEQPLQGVAGLKDLYQFDAAVGQDTDMPTSGQDSRELSPDHLTDADAEEKVLPVDQHQASTDGGSIADRDEHIPEYLKPYAVAPVKWDSDKKVTPPVLLRGVLRPYQQSGLEWLASLHTNKLNGILADEMGLGKTIQTISLLAHLACDLGIWGPHLIVVPTSVLLNWEMEFKKFLPGFRVLSYHGNTKRRKELRQGWNDRHHFNVCVTSYALASRDSHIFKRKAWYYLILDEAHMIKNFKSQRWNILLMFRSYRRLLLTGTPLQNNLTELWALLQFLMSGANFANLKEFGDWFSNPLEKAIELGNVNNEDTLQRVSKLHTVLRPYLLRRLKRDVEKELPSKFEHLTLCPISKRQRLLYDEFMSRAQTRDALQSGIYQKIANILMQLRKVCNHPDLFEVRPILTSFAMRRSAIADFEIKELLVRRRLLIEQDEIISLDMLGFCFIDQQNISLLNAVETRRLDASACLLRLSENLGEAPVKDTRTIAGFREFSVYSRRAEEVARRGHRGYLNKLRCNRIPVYGEECLSIVKQMSTSIIPFTGSGTRSNYMDNVDRVNVTVKSYSARAEEMSDLLRIFAFATPPAIALDLPRITLAGSIDIIQQQPLEFDQPLHAAAVKLQIAFPEPSLLQYDCGKLQKLASLLREKKAGGHRVLIFTQMTKILDILETFLNIHGYLYLRLDGSTKIEDRQYITERFNADSRIFCFISSSRSGGVGINLTGADTVIFYDSDFNPQMDKQCEDRAHRIGQIRDVHIYRFVSQYTVEEAMLRKANQKRSLDDLVIQKGEFDWRSLFNDDSTSALTNALGEYEDAEDHLAAVAAAREETSLVGADEDDFDELEGSFMAGNIEPNEERGLEQDENENEGDEEQGGTVVDFMVTFVERNWEDFCDWKL